MTTVPPLPWPTPEQPAADRGEDHFRDEVLRRLFERRMVFLRGALDDAAATRLAAELLTLEAGSSAPVTLQVHSRGGPLTALFAVTDTIAAMVAPVDTICVGHAEGTAAAVLAAGTGTRRATASARISLRQASAELCGTARQLEQEAAALQWLHERLVALLSRTTGRPTDAVAADVDAGRILDAVQARRYGLVDEVVEPRTRR